MKRNILIIAGTVLIVLASFGGVAYAANPSNPGDFLYGADRATEAIQETATFNQEKLAEVRLDHLDERLDEIEALSGKLETLEDDDAVKGAEDELDDMIGSIEGEMDQATDDYENGKLPQDAFEAIKARYAEITAKRIAHFTELKEQVGEAAQDQMDALIEKAQEKETKMNEKMDALIQKMNEKSNNSDKGKNQNNGKADDSNDNETEVE